MKGDAEAKKTAELFRQMFGMKISEGEENIFMDRSLEIMKGTGVGKNGHIAFAVDNIEEAIFDMQKRGVRFARDKFKYDPEGGIAAAYLEREIAGFAIHLVPHSQ
ncbi:MAG TPA: VOC family protein [Candidatus Mediterraneibacter norfolkensis]|nr:VOC family protein [Candidatus Mediterraneibacter norfolkensis]